jgi:serine/threonine protein kinase
MPLIFGVTGEDVDRELEVIRQVCLSGHRQIIQVFHQDRLRSSEIYYFYMELCHMNLHEYIHGHRSLVLQSNQRHANPFVFVGKDASTRQRTINLWTIVYEVSEGLKFVHSKRYTHRDLKPENGIRGFKLG